MTPDHSPFTPYRPSSPDAPDLASPACREVLVNLWDHLDGSCCPELAGRIEAHTSSCVPCFRLRRSWERFFAVLAELPTRSPAPPRVHERVRRALEAERRQSPRA